MADPALPAALAPLRDRAADAGLFLDFDGTLAPIVPDPAAARPLPGTCELLAALAGRLAVVAVVSGRPASFLRDVLGTPLGVRLAGLYGMEEVGPDGTVRADPEAEGWRPAVASATQVLATTLPPGAHVEEKGLSVAVHWRRAPGAERDALAAARQAAAREGLVLQAGRMSVELRPPAHADKGTVVERLAGQLGVVAYAGDDAGDLPAFAALDSMRASGRTVVRIAVADEESPPSLISAADVVVDAPEEALSLLRALAASLRVLPPARR